MPRAPFQVLVLPYRRTAAGMEVAVLHRADYDAWQFVSGGGEAGETIDMAARREAREEAAIPAGADYLALDAKAMIPACWFSAWPTWPEATLLVPEHAFAVDVGDHALVLSDEHDEVRWLHYDDAIALLRFDSNRTALWELHERLYPAVRCKRAAFDTRHAGNCACSPPARATERSSPL
jgi:dihydroneopterin triphosphate diphosphatase